MSDWLVHLIRLAKVGNHPKADRLSITQVYGQSVIMQRGLFNEGDLAVFLPPESVLPLDPEHQLVKSTKLPAGHCIEAKKLRDIFSNGMLVPARELFSEEQLATITPGTHVAEMLGVTKYVDEGEKLSTGGDNERDHGYMPTYTDIEGWAKYRDAGAINTSDEVVLTEKLHGCNGRVTYRDGRLWMGSRTNIKAQQVSYGQEKSLWWKVAKDIGLEEKFLKLHEAGYSDKTVVYGEVYGQVQKGFNYDQEPGKASFRVFDSYDGNTGVYNDWDVTKAIVEVMGLETVPELYRGPWNPELEGLQNGTETVSGKNLHMREGFVLKPVKEQWVSFNPELAGSHTSESGYHGFTGRKIFKVVGTAYKLRNKKPNV